MPENLKTAPFTSEVMRRLKTTHIDIVSNPISILQRSAMPENIKVGYLTGIFFRLFDQQDFLAI